MASYRRTVTVRNPKGLHARPSAAVAEIAKAYDATIFVHYNGETEEAESILGLLTLGAAPGVKLSIRAKGPDAKPAVDAIVGFLAEGSDKR